MILATITYCEFIISNVFIMLSEIFILKQAISCEEGENMMLKRFLSILCVGALTFTSFSISVSAEDVDSANESCIVEDSVSESVLEEGLYEDAKVQRFDSLTDGSKACHDLTEMKSDSNQKKRKSESITTTRHVENCVIVKTEQDIAFNTEKVIAAVRYGKNYYIQYRTDSDAEAAVAEFELYPTVRYAVTDRIISYDTGGYIEGDARTSQDVNGYAHYTWGADAMSLPIYADYISRTTTGNVVVAVLDTGIKAEHELFQGRLLQGYDYVNDDTDPRDDEGHGTHVAGIIADCTQGLNVSILPVKVLTFGIWGGVDGSLRDSLAGMQYAIAQDVDVINLSLGSYSSVAEEFCEEIDEAVSKGITVVAASGNDYCNIDIYGLHPAHKTNIIVTAAVDSNLQNYHTGVYSGSNYGPSVDVTAPGVDVKSAFYNNTNNINNKYVMNTGTSMAAPHITAAAAMLKLKYPNDTCAQIENKLRSCAMDLGDPGYDQHYGAGLPVLSNLITSLPFYDVSSSAWFYDGVFKVYTKGYMTGRSRNYFVPSDNMKRQDVAVVFYRMSNYPFVEYRNIYNDVSSDSYFANAAVWAYDNNIIKGYPNGTMGVDNNITRQDFMLTLYSYAKHKGLNISASTNISGYTDQAQVSEYARTAMSWGVAKGLIGRGTTLLNPLGNVGRAEIAVMIERFIQAYNL